MYLRVAALLLSASQIARAETSASALSFDPEMQLGWLQGKHSSGLGFGLTARLSYSIFTAGLSAQGAMLFNAMTSVSAVGGLSIPIGFVRVDALGELGYNAYSAVGADLLGDDPGANARLPFAGARLSLLGRIFRSHTGRSLWLGPAVQYAKDLYTTKRTYTYEGSDWLSGDDYVATETVRIGQPRWSFLAVLSASLPM
jgi:hypothetical protein